MAEILEIEWWRLGLAMSLMLVPILLLVFYETGLGKSVLIAGARMIVQLILVGVYLEYLFERNSLLLNGIWIVIMLVVAGMTILRRSELPLLRFLPAVFFALALAMLPALGVFLGFVLASPDALHARYIIPITGMLLGNGLQSGIIGLSKFRGAMCEKRSYYEYLLACGANRREALVEFKRDALKAAMSPAIATLSTIGLISLPGMMTGQILGGSAPMEAVKYQIMIMTAIFSGNATALVLAIEFVIRGMLGPDDLPRL